jgi:hypothetical protein
MARPRDITDIVKIKKDDLVRMILGVNELTKMEVLVGIPKENNDRGDGSGFGNAAIAYMNEFGSPANNIPARPHIIPGIEKVLPKVVEDGLKQAGLSALKGKKEDIPKGFYIAGQLCADSIRDYIRQGLTPPLKQSTLDARRAKGHFGTTPLIESGNYYQHITFIVKPKD